MPFKQTLNIDESLYKDLVINKSVNFFNESDPFYNDRCFVYRVNGTDIPLNTRRKKIYPNVTGTCGTNCEMKGIDSYGNMECECHNPTKCASGDLIQDFEETALDVFETSNFGIVTCDVRHFI